MIYRRKYNKGFYLIGLLIALMIIMILTGKYMGGDKSTNTPPVTTNIDRSKKAACSANRLQLQTSIQMWSVTHPGETPTLEKLREARYTVPTCPSGGEYTIGESDQVTCSVHTE